MRLESSGIDALVLAEVGGLDVASIDWGWPSPRDVVEPRPSAHGTIDSTSLFGARVITVQFWLDSCPAVSRRALQRFLDPGRRSYMYFRESADDPELRVLVRGSAWSEQVPASVLVSGQRSVVAQWVAPDGILEAAEATETTVPATATAGTAGFTVPITTPLVFPDSVPIGSATIVNGGTVDSYPVIRVYGPCADPVVENQTVGRELAFDGLTVNAGEYVELDTRARTVLYLSDPGDSRYADLDFATSSWWSLAPGENAVRLAPASFSEPSQMVVTHRDAYLNI